MRTVGHRKEQPITFSASGKLLKEGAIFNDEIHRLPSGNETRVRKGVYRFKSLADADKHLQECLIAAMVEIARERM